MIAITGANGKLGKAILHNLMQQTASDQIITIVRDPAKMDDLLHTGIQVRAAAYDDLPALKQALQGAQKLLQISTTSIGEKGIEQEKNVVTMAKEQCVKHIIYTSSVTPKQEAFFLPTQQSLQTEQAILQTGLPYTFFRNSLYMESIPELIGNALEDGAIYYPAGNGKVSFVSRLDIAAALANVLVEGGHENQQYEITGQQAYSFRDIAGMLTGKGGAVKYVDISHDAYLAALSAFHLPDEIVHLLGSMAAGIKAGEFSYVDNTLEILLRRKPVTLSGYLNGL